MEFVTVKYWRRRNVYIDGQKSGYTNTVLQTNRGTHVFTLGDPPNYEPLQRRKKVQKTNPVKPLVVEFTPKGP